MESDIRITIEGAPKSGKTSIVNHLIETFEDFNTTWIVNDGNSPTRIIKDHNHDDLRITTINL